MSPAKKKVAKKVAAKKVTVAPAPKRRTFYYHASAVPLPVGKTLRGLPGNVGKARASVEKLFERFRPRGKPTRISAWFLGKTPDDLGALGASSLGYVYQVTAEGPLHRGDFEWLWRAGTYEMGARHGVNMDGSVGPPHWNAADEQTVAPLIESYWSGASSGDRARFEYHTPAIHIIKKVK